MRRTSNRQPGFSLLEMALVIAILAVILFLVISISIQSIARSNTHNARNYVVQSLRRAQTLAQSNIDASRAGVYLCQNALQSGCAGLPTSVILFQRSTFSPYNPTEDDLFEVPSSITFGGPLFTNMLAGNGIVFTQLIGEPNVTGNLTITDGKASTTVTLNAKGAVD